jgi:hypothetical protein
MYSHQDEGNFTKISWDKGKPLFTQLTQLSDPEKDVVVMRLMAEFDRYKRGRTGREDVWMETEAMYYGSPDAIEYLRSHVGKIVGDVNDDWRHRIQVSKGYEIVETIVAYLMGAFFPNRDWFDFIPHEPGIQDLVDVVKKFTIVKMRDSDFTSKWEIYIRQLIITGFSSMLLTWERDYRPVHQRGQQEVVTQTLLGEKVSSTHWVPRVERKLVKNKILFEPLSVYDVYVDPNASTPQDSGVFRIIRKTKGDIVRCIARGDYPYLSVEDIARHKSQNPSDTTKKQQTSTWMGIQYRPDEMVELIEYWGDLEVDESVYENIHAVFFGRHLCKFEANPYWCGVPFIFGSCIPMAHKPYGLGVLEPVLGMLHQLNIITNQRLDSLELAVDSMWQVINDGVTDVDDIYTRPGKVILVGQKGSVEPFQKDLSFQVSYTEAQVLEQNIDQAVGTGAYIGTQQGRSGERVTATEIQAVRDAGGNRLSNIHKQIENTQLTPLLRKLFVFFRQFVTEDEVVRVPSQEGYEYVQVGAEELSHEFDVLAVGADHVAEKEKDLQMLIDFVAMVSNVPMWAELVNWEELLQEVIRKFGFDPDVAQLLIAPPPPPEEEAPIDPAQDALATARGMGGKPMEDATAAQMLLEGGNTVAAKQQAALGGQDMEAAALMGQMLDQAQMPQQ